MKRQYSDEYSRGIEVKRDLLRGNLSRRNLSRRGRRSSGGIIAYLLLLVFVVINIYPLLWIVSTSLKDRNEPFRNETLVPEKLIWGNYVKLLVEENVTISFFNSVKMTVLPGVTHLVLAGLAAYAFARFDFPGKAFFFIFFLASLMVPWFVGLVPLYLLVRNLHMSNTHWGLFFPYSVSGLAVSIYLIRTFLENIPSELEDAAKIDGASALRIFWSVMLPLARPALVTVAIIRSLSTWGEFMWAYLVIQDEGLKTLPVIIREFIGKYPDRWELIATVSIVTMVPVLVAFAFMQKQFIRGFVEGAIKG